jgi:hypothetical protein
MQHHLIAGVFNQTYNGAKNFMTPNVLSYGKRGKMVYELSTGRGFRDQQIWGVTVIELPSTKRRDLAESFDSYEEAKAYITNDFTLREEAQ